MRVFAADAEGGSEDDENAGKESDATKESETPEPPIETSNAIKELLIALEFNSIDMYNWCPACSGPWPSREQ